jgi:hypothetical protein
MLKSDASEPAEYSVTSPRISEKRADGAAYPCENQQWGARVRAGGVAVHMSSAMCTALTETHEYGWEREG